MIRTTAKPPVTKTVPVKEMVQGTEIVDPYRWLEGDNADPDDMGKVTPEVAAWTDAQNAYTRSVARPPAGPRRRSRRRCGR